MSEVRHVQVKLPADLAEWFDANCPFSKQDFAEQCFALLRIAVVSGALPVPGIYAAKSAIMAVEALGSKCPNCSNPYPGKQILVGDDQKHCAQCGRKLY